MRLPPLPMLLLSAALLAANASASTYELIPLGYFDEIHTRADGFQQGLVQFLNENGDAVGYSRRVGGIGGRTAWVYDADTGTTTRVGYFDGIHLGTYQQQSSEFTALTDSGYAAGFSLQIKEGYEVGRSIWLYDLTQGTTTRLGFFDADLGYQHGSVDFLTESGYAAGHTDRFVKAYQYNRSAWLYDAAMGTQVRLGLQEDGYTGDAGDGNTTVSQLTESGHTAGVTSRYLEASGGGAAWVRNGTTGTTTRLGFLDAEHTNANEPADVRLSTVTHLAESGDAAGTSARFAPLGDPGPAYRGWSVWYYDASEGTTTRVGYFGADHSSTVYAGRQESIPIALSRSGRLLAGHSTRYLPAGLPYDLLGNDAWLYEAVTGSTTRLGFFDAEHTDVTGIQYSAVAFLADTGYVAGYSSRYSAECGSWGACGESAWLYDVAAQRTTRLGFRDGAHTSFLGYQSSFVTALTESGYAAGYSRRYVGDDLYEGRSAWLYHAPSDVTVRLGLVDARHTSAYGWQRSEVTFVTESGYAAGFSYQADEGVYGGRSVWIYEPGSGLHHTLDAIADPGLYSNQTVSYLGEDGLALGTYTVPCTPGACGPKNFRVFAWSPQQGAVDLNVEDGLADEEWSQLANVLRGNARGDIVGQATTLAAGDVPYLLRPVPEATGGEALAALVLLAFAASRRR